MPLPAISPTRSVSLIVRARSLNSVRGEITPTFRRWIKLMVASVSSPDATEARGHAKGQAKGAPDRRGWRKEVRSSVRPAPRRNIAGHARVHVGDADCKRPYI